MKQVILILLGLILTTSTMAHVNLTSSFGGKIFMAGDTVKITYEVEISHDLQNWDLFFSEDGGTTWDTIKLNVKASKRSFQWKVPNISTNRGKVKVVMDNSGTDYSDVSNSFTTQSTTGLSSEYWKNNTQIFPNPVKNHLKINFSEEVEGDLIVTLRSLKGRVLKMEHLKPGKSNLYGFTLPPGIKPGVYLIGLKNKKGRIAKKVIVQ